jgi:hypothetical protein
MSKQQWRLPLRAATSMGCSAGVTSWRPGDSASLSVSRADVALYRAKLTGSNRTVLEPSGEVSLAIELADATANGDVEVLYQIVGFAVPAQFLRVPSCNICSAFSTLRVPDAWLGGYSWKVARNSPTMFMAGTIVHSFSPHQRPYSMPSVW